MVVHCAGPSPLFSIDERASPNAAWSVRAGMGVDSLHCRPSPTMFARQAFATAGWPVDDTCAASPPLPPPSRLTAATLRDRNRGRGCGGGWEVVATAGADPSG